jgi:undecaprenyl-diphosphatase
LGLLWWLGPESARPTVAVYVLGIFLTAGLVFAIKFTVRRQRPEGEWGSIYRSTDPHSFPSGHAARATMLSILGIGLGPAWLGIILLIWAPLVGLARVAMGVHYLSDVLAGMLLGLVVGMLIVAFV